MPWAADDDVHQLLVAANCKNLVTREQRSIVADFDHVRLVRLGRTSTQKTWRGATRRQHKSGIIHESSFSSVPAGRLSGRVQGSRSVPVSYTHLRAHETVLDLVCRLLLEK